jgi:hypothetical protein
MKRSWNCDGKNVHQYQQNEQSTFTLTHWTQKGVAKYEAANPGTGLEQAHECGGVIPVDRIPTLSFW